MKVLIIGSGHVGAPLLSALCAKGVDAWATTTSKAKLPSNDRLLLLDASNASQVMDVIAGVNPDFVVSALAPTRQMAPEQYRSFFTGTTSNIIAALDGDEQQLVYLGSSAPYGDHGGAVVDEFSDLKARSMRGITQRMCQEMVLKYGLPTILRFGGLYNENMSTLLLRQKTDPSAGSKDRVINWTHTEDAVNGVIHVIEQGLTGVFNLASLSITAGDLMPRVSVWTGEVKDWNETNCAMSVDKIKAAGFTPSHNQLC